jgi:hypothetical protein
LYLMARWLTVAPSHVQLNWKREHFPLCLHVSFRIHSELTNLAQVPSPESTGVTRELGVLTGQARSCDQFPNSRWRATHPHALRVG